MNDYMRNIKAVLIGDDLSFGLNVKMILDGMGIELIARYHTIAEIKKSKLLSIADVILSDIKVQQDELVSDFFMDLDRNDTPLIYCTNHTTPEIYNKAKQTLPSAILIKPFDPLTLRNAIKNSLVKKKYPSIQKNQNYLFVKERSELYRIDFDDIDSIHAEGNYCMVNNKGKKFVVRSSLKNLYEKLPKESFIRVHRNFVVNINHITSVNIKSNEILMDQMKLPIGRSFKKGLLLQINNI